MDTYISKSDFKIGQTCHKKLWYKKNGYPTKNDDNEYLQYLAKGGYIVNKMAQLIYDGGTDLSHIKDPRQAVEETKRLIDNNKRIIIYEAAVYANNKLARIDILEKKGNELHIIEVKAKSQHSEDDDQKMPREYLDDVIFQYITVEEAFGKEYSIKASLFLPDKSKLNKIEGLAGWFVVKEDAVVNDMDELAARSSGFYLPKVEFRYHDHADREQYLAKLRQNSILEIADIKSFAAVKDWDAAKDTIRNAANNLYASLTSNHPAPLTRKCRDCEYQSDAEDKNGFHTCWHEYKGQDLSAFELYYGGSVKHQKAFYLDKLIQQKTVSLKDVEQVVLTKGEKETKWSSRTIRQLMQLGAAIEGKEQIKKEVLMQEMNTWEFPLHFIDFETYTGAIPFHKNMRPYETIAFQWSCHTLTKDGTLTHAEWINMEEAFPNFKFAEKLMAQVGHTGTPLMWSHHENTVLRHILGQMDIQNYRNDELKAWLIAMTHDSNTKRKGRLVDMARLCEKAYLHPDCKGKVSIKKILPAVWNNPANKTLHQQPEFTTYFKEENGKILDPYKTLNPVKEFLNAAELESMDVVAEGTAAMKAYFELMYGKGRGDKARKKEIEKLLLQYCKLDTIAMVIIYKYWQSVIDM